MSILEMKKKAVLSQILPSIVPTIIKPVDKAIVQSKHIPKIASSFCCLFPEMALKSS